MKRNKPYLIAGTMLLTALAHEAHAHPHVFAEARLEIIANGEGQVEALRHVWRFDDMFSSTVLVDFDKNMNLKLDSEELKEVGSVVHESLADFNYFQIVMANGEEVEMAAPPEMMADFSDNQLTLLFESKPKGDLRLKGSTSFGVYDPTFYTAIEFPDDGHMQVENLPGNCKLKVVRPDPDEAIAQNQDMLTPDFFEDASNNDLSKIFATRLEVTCDE